MPDEPFILIRSSADVDHWMGLLRASAHAAQQAIVAHTGDPLELLRKMKFDLFGRHPVEDRALNLVEQVNQTWTFAVALAAVRELLVLHPDAEGFKVAAGAHMALPLDIMSRAQDLVGAETFAAVDPANNRKLSRDLAKMARRAEQHRYVFFSSPKFPGVQHQRRLDRGGVQVWSVDV
jgi:hypothetical protein